MQKTTSALLPSVSNRLAKAANIFSREVLNLIKREYPP